MIIRDFEINDIKKGLLDVYKEVWYIEEITEKSVTDYLNNDNHMIVAEDNGFIVATLTLHLQKKLIRNGSVAGFIEDFAVKENYRGNNLGSKMIEYILKKATHFGCYKVVLSCFPERINFYERNGFKKESTTMRFYI